MTFVLSSLCVSLICRQGTRYSRTLAKMPNPTWQVFVLKTVQSNELHLPFTTRWKKLIQTWKCYSLMRVIHAIFQNNTSFRFQIKFIYLARKAKPLSSNKGLCTDEKSLCRKMARLWTHNEISLLESPVPQARRQLKSPFLKQVHWPWWGHGGGGTLKKNGLNCFIVCWKQEKLITSMWEMGHG